MLNSTMNGDNKISILMGSDFHFGSKRSSSHEMAFAFAETIFPLLPTTNLFNLNGDFFDDILSFDHLGFDPIHRVVMQLFQLCERYNVTVRLLQGTWTHDRTQCKRIVEFYESGNYTFNFKFIDKIEIEEIAFKERALRFCYVPDNMPFTNSTGIIEVIKDLMMTRGWDNLDYACLHGFTDFTFPKVLNKATHVVYEEHQFDFITKLIDVGHVHQHRAVGKMVSNGSFDRLCHGEEEPKGLVQIDDYPSSWTLRFIHNKHPAIFNTVKIPLGAETQDVSKIIDDHMVTINTVRRINLRFELFDLSLREAIQTYMGQNYPAVKVDIKKVGDKDEGHTRPVSSVIVPIKESNPIPTPETLSTFVKALLPTDVDLTLKQIDMYFGKVA